MPAVGTWWYGQHSSACSCGPKAAGEAGYGCQKADEPLVIGGPDTG
ncbi:hypothetical protein LG634_34675 [Streptomyces bambusae]|nr:hypothetical protein [Streptomyces bambusae]MCB5169934.1 hypothetical protein [Streptomyces bambusae]